MEFIIFSCSSDGTILNTLKKKQLRGLSQFLKDLLGDFSLVYTGLAQGARTGKVIFLADLS